MALVLKVSACTLNCCKLLVLRDISGDYDVISNPTGWGAPNLSFASVTAATLDITMPSGAVISADPTTLLATINAAATSPFDLEDFLPSGTTFPDGIYHIDYEVTDGVDTYNTSVDILIDCNVSCCVDKMFALLPNKMCDTCNYQEFLDNALLAEALLQALRCASSCGDTTKADGILESLQTICDWADCNCGS